MIICTRNRAQSLARCLDHYANVISNLKWELIVVNNLSTDGTEALLSARLKDRRLPLVVLVEPKPGLSQARNTGIRHASSDLICFSDDDCYPDTSFINAWQDVFSNTDIGFGGGRIELFDPADADCTLKTDRVAHLFSPRSLIKPGSLHGASLAFRRNVIEKIGYFDPKLGAGSRLQSAEDTEYVQRASEFGFTGLYSPGPLVWHHHGRKPHDIPALNVGYEIGTGAFYACVLFRSPYILWQAFVNDFRRSPTLLAYLKALYWRNKGGFFKYAWNFSRGFMRFVILHFCRMTKIAEPLPLPGHRAIASQTENGEQRLRM